MKLSLKNRLSFSYVLLTLICVSLICLMTNIFLERQFRTYVKHNQKNKNVEIVNMVRQQLGEAGKWNAKGLESVGTAALEEGMLIKVTDLAGKAVWDASVHNKGLCKQMLEHMAKNMVKHYPGWDGKYRANLYDIIKDKRKVGSVTIGYYGPFYYNDDDLAFISDFNKMILGLGAISLILALMEYDSEKLNLNKVYYDLSEQVRHIIRYFENDFHTRGIKATLYGANILIFADRDRMSQIIFNLLSNTLKYTQREGYVDIFLKSEGDSAVISIKDTGVGIPAEDLPFIFERFYRVDKSRNRLTGGSGLGLTIVKSIVEAHNGNINVSSEQGRGTEFIISIPGKDEK